MSGQGLSWGWIAGGATVGTLLFLAAVVWLGRRIFRHMGLLDRGDWDRPLPHPLPKHQVVAVYVRRRGFHRRHRDHFVRPHPHDPRDPGARRG